MSASNARKRILLHPGEYRVANRAVTMSTLLGSCVAVCLYDPAHRLMGMNHFLLAERRRGDSLPLLASEAGRYGIHAMEMLVNDLLELGAQNSDLRAKAFGGSSMLKNNYVADDRLAGIGSVNIKFVREFLSFHQIPLVSSDLGGDHGRQIHFSGDDYSVYVRRIPIQQSRRILEQEQKYWQKSTGNRHEKR